MKRIILILLVVAVGSYFTYHFFEGKARERVEKRAEQVRAQKLRESYRSAISKMVAKYGAIENWEQKLSEGRTKPSEDKILTIDLQQLWITDKPILFKGVIDDIRTLSPNSYSIWLEQEINIHKSVILENLALALACPRVIVDPFLSAHPEVKKENYPSVVVIAKILKVVNRSQLSKKPNEETTELVGVGKCLDLLYRDKTGLEPDEF